MIKEILKAKCARCKERHNLISERIHIDFGWKQNVTVLPDLHWFPRKGGKLIPHWMLRIYSTLSLQWALLNATSSVAGLLKEVS